MNVNFRLGILGQRILFDFDGWLLDQMKKVALGSRNQLRFAGCSMGRGGRCFVTLS